MANNSNNYWNGSNGNLWFNDSEFDKVKSFECKMTIEWEDVPDGLTTERVLMGYSYEGSFSYRKTDKNHKTVMDEVFEDYSNGKVSDVSVIGKAFNKATGKTVVKINPDFFRPAEVDILIGDPIKAETKLGWKREIPFVELVERMIKNDLMLVEKELKHK